MKNALLRPSRSVKGLLCAAAALFLLGNGQLSAQIKLKLQNVTVKEAITALNVQENYSVVIQSDGIDTSKKVSVDITDGSIEEVLAKIFEGQNVSFEVNQKNVSVVKRSDNAAPVKGAKNVIKGVVKDQNGLPVIGAGIVVEGTSAGSITDMDGNFSIEGVKSLPVTLKLSCLGYADQTVSVNNWAVQSFVMAEDMLGLDEVVIIGYGQQKKINITGAVGVVEGKDLQNRPVTNAAAALQGADPSLLLTLGSGSIEAKNYNISIRGAVSLNSGEPLVMIDGVEGSLDQLNPNDIESVSILKDASACAIYGAKASAGVVLITTKAGKKDEMKINYTGRFGVQKNTTSTDFLTTGYEHVTFTNDFYNAYRGHPAWTFNDDQIAMMKERVNDKTENPDRPWVVPDESGKYTYVYLGNFDWYDFFFKRTRPETEHNLSVSGGNDKVNYYVSGRYLYREGLFAGVAEDKFNGYSLRSKIDAKVTPWLTYTGNISMESSRYDYGGFREQDGAESIMSAGILWNITQNITPAYVPYNPDGTVNILPGYMADATSPLASGRGGVFMDDRNKNARQTNNWVLTNRLTFDITSDKSLKFIADYSYRRRDRLETYRSLPTPNCYDNINKRMYEGNGLTGGLFSNGSVLDMYDEKRFYSDASTANAYLQFAKEWGKHNVSATAGANYEDFHSSQLRIQQNGTLSPNLSFINMAQGEIAKAAEKNNAYRTLGYFARANYDYAGKYLFEVSGRYDGSSRFPADSRWGFFPSASAGWRISEENFWKNSALKSVWNNAKIRFSYGSLGNQQVANYYYFDRISTNLLTYTFDGVSKAGYASISDPITDGLTWETVTTYNVGLDFGFFNNRLTLTADAYIRDTKDMLTTSLTLPDVYGAASPKSNAADLRTKGYEVMVSWKDTRKLMSKPLHYGVSASLGDYTTTITKYNNPDRLLSDFYEGQTLGDIWGYKVAGLFKTDDEAEEFQAAIDDKAVNGEVYKCAAPMNRLMAGDVRFIDLNGDNKINAGAGTVDDPGDMVIVGNNRPRYTYSFRGNLNWNGIGISAFFQGVGQIDWMPVKTCAYFWNTYQYARTAFIASDFPEKTWTEDNRNAYFPRHRTYQGNATGALGVVSDRYLQNARYLRLKNLSVDYTFPINKQYINKLRVYFSGENLFYWSPLTKHCTTVDPEVSVNSAADDCLYPYSKTFSVGVDITF